MDPIGFIGNHTFLIGAALVGGFCIYKFIIEPIMNEGKPIEPSNEDIKTFGEKMSENLNTDINI